MYLFDFNHGSKVKKRVDLKTYSLIIYFPPIFFPTEVLGFGVGRGDGLDRGVGLTTGRGLDIVLGFVVGLGVGRGLEIVLGFVEELGVVVGLGWAVPELVTGFLSSRATGLGVGFGGVGRSGLTLIGSLGETGLRTVPLVGSSTIGGLLGPIFK
tara:strand:- start:259 stop:720 length:462 start_codon:yes stop_codon:yes gene_type:complete